MSQKDFLAFFADEKGNEFGGVMARTMGEEQVVWMGAPEAGKAELKLYALSEERFLNALVYTKERDLDRYKTKLMRFPVKTDGLEPQARFSVEVSSQFDRARITLPIDKPGTYYLEGNMNGRHGEMLLVASNIVAQTKEEGKNLVVWTVDSRTGKHVSSGEVIQYQLSKSKKEMDRSGIDSQGFARLSRTEEGDIMLLRAAGEVAFIPLNYASHVPQPVNYGWWGGRFASYATLSRSYSFTDRMLYQPGDKVYFKSILRRDDDARYTVPDGVAQVKIWTGWGEEESVVLEKAYPIKDGAIDGQLVLPKDVKTGEYYYSVSFGGLSEQEGFYFPVSDAMFTVDYYRKPEFGLDIAVAKDRLIVGDTLEFDISGSYFSGERAVGKKVAYTVSAGTYSDYGYQRDFQDDDGYRYGGWYGPSVATGEVTLGPDGAYRMTVPTTAHEKHLPQVYHIEVSASDASENPVYESRNTLVLPGDFSIYRTDYTYGGRVGETKELAFQLVANREGVSLGGRTFTVAVHHERWINDSPSELYSYYTKVEKDLPSLSMTTDESGRAMLTFAPPEEGSYTFSLSGTDDRGNIIVREVWLWASDKNGWYYRSEGDGKSLLSIATDKERYLPGETAMVTLASPLSGRDVWLTVERAGVHRSEVVRLDGNAATFKLPLVTGDMPNVFLSGTVFSDVALSTANAEIAVSPESERITVEIRPDKKQYEPGETVSLEVVGKNSEGKPVAGEVALWAIDKALFELLDQSPADIFKKFWDERYHDTLSAHSLEGVLFTLELAERGGCFVGDTKVLMSDGTSKFISDVRAGDAVLTRRSERDSTLVSAQVTGTHTVTVDGYLVFNNTLKVTPEHKMFVNGVWEVAGNVQIGDVLVDEKGNTVPIESLEFVREKVPVYNLAIDTYHTYFAGDVWVHNNKSGGIRSAFKDTAYWNPRVRLGENGKARVTFKLPDNATTWVISGVTTAGSSQFGQAREEITASKNVLITQSLPPFMRVGDRVGIKVTVRNNTEETLDFSVRGDFEKGAVVDGNVRTLTVGPKRSEDTMLTYVPEIQAAQAAFTVRAEGMGSGNEFSDAVTQTLPIKVAGFVQKSGEAKEGNAEYTVKFPEGTNDAQSKLVLDLAPSLLGTIPTAMRGLLDYPYGCVEQTTSRFVPLVIAHREKGIFAEAIKGKDTTKMLEKGIEHLGNLQNEEGGWGFWSGGESNPYVTSYVIEYLLEARSLGVRVDDITLMLASARTYVDRASKEAIATREKNLPLTYSAAESEEVFKSLISLAYAKSLLGLSVEPRETHEGVLIPSYALLSPELLSLAIRVNTRMGDFDMSQNGVEALMAKVKKGEAGWYWDAGKIDYYASQDAATAMAVQALIAARYDHEALVPAVRFLTASRKAGYWSNTYATVQVIRALVDFSKQGVAQNPEYAYRVELDGKLIKEGKMTSHLTNISLSIAGEMIRPEGSVLKVSYVGTGELYSSLLQTLARESATFVGESHGMMLTRKYENVTRPGAVPALGDTVRVVLSVSGVKQARNRLVVEDTLPAGMVPIHENFKNERGATNPENRRYYNSWVDEYTENGAVITMYAYGLDLYEMSYLARVVNTGEYYAPPAYAELMYSPMVYAYSGASREIFPETSVAPKKPFIERSLKIGESRDQGEVLMWLVTGLALFSAISATFLVWQKHRKLS